LLAAIVVFLYLFIIFFDFLPVAKSGRKKECIVYLALLTISFAILILYVFGFKLPSHFRIIQDLIQKIFGI